MFFFLFFLYLIFFSAAIRECDEEDEKKFENRYAIHFVSKVHNADQQGRIPLYPSAGDSKGKPRVWFHLSTSVDSTDPSEKSFFRNHVQWKELRSYKVIIPWKELRQSVKEQSRNIKVRPSDGSIAIEGTDPIWVKNAKIETEFYWYQDRIGFKYILQYLVGINILSYIFYIIYFSDQYFYKLRKILAKR